jgi:5-methylcytosine-specific restriction protein A
MSRKRFIQQNGATCKNWYWSWSFINEAEKVIIFGAWDFTEQGHMTMIFSDTWEYNHKQQRSKGYDQSLEHIRLVENEGYRLKTFLMYHSTGNKDKNGIGPAKIARFDRILEDKILVRIDGDYFASSRDGITNISEEVSEPEKYFEGATSKISINAFERNAKARMKCIELFGYKCQVCNFDFQEVYGDLGKDYIHVHHIVPLSEIKENYEVNPITDLIPVCPNCHAIIHRTRQALPIKVLREIIRK